MKYDEFAFFNQQLAAMLRDGIPLEGAVRRLCEEMSRGALRDELQALAADLARGTPIAGALHARRLPQLYKQLVLVGAKSGSLPEALTMLADYYHRQNNLWIRLKGLMLYPLIVLFVAFLVSTLLVFTWNRGAETSWSVLLNIGEGRPLPGAVRATQPLLENMWIFPTIFGLLLLSALAVWFVPAIQDAFRWRLPAFREASLARVASSIQLLLKGGLPLPDAIGLTQQLESSKAIAADLDRWRQNLARGLTRFPAIAATNRVVPPLFVWMVANGGEDLAAGFARAAEIYGTRAERRAETVLYTALPVAVLFLGAIVLSQAYLLLNGMLVLIDLLNNLGS